MIEASELDMSANAIDKHAIAQGAILAGLSALFVGMVNIAVDELKHALAARRAAAEKAAKEVAVAK